MPRRHARPILPTKFFEQAETDYGLPASERWLLTRRPFPDESLASWFARQAEIMGTDSRQLAHLLTDELGKSPESLCRDFDVAAADDTVLNRLAARAAVSATALARMATHRMLGTGLSGRKLVKHWLIRRSQAAQLLSATHICPECLAADGTPYLRRNWRLGWFTTCAIHRKSLIDACPHCGHSLLTNAMSIHRLLQRECPECGGRVDLALAEMPMPEVLALEDTLRRALQTGIWEPAPGYRSNSLALLMVVDRLFAYLLAKSLGREDAFFIIRNRNLLTIPDRHARSAAGSPLSLRQDLLRMIGKLWTHWPAHMMRIVDNENFGIPWRPRDGTRLGKLAYKERDCRLYAATLFDQLALPLEMTPAPVPAKQKVPRRRTKLDYDILY